ncbi:probable tRNA N6-adenosine threonylcarbamoyltransferase, mitochondrial [Drosophila subpulchrella]|uniref:probable tRNA N6-adenosine threonylcarbamoyltransferase, mitochondrial n=1 Tax=Drosophila subpulchrella TaxID=1486046 RepID=UPI0018A1565A|nr:probable tRNA N6-adenosine threonylcarbamoyltransferase, mitochondrial [Drosophila subpulchrella]
MHALRCLAGNGIPVGKAFGEGIRRRLSYVLGIETSCDDTGIAIVDTAGRVRANVLESQQEFHTRYGGIIPPRAQDLHRARIESAFERCLAEAQLEPEELAAIAVTTRPGLPLSLLVGLRFARHLARRLQKPLLPVHHMEAHALQARMEHPEQIPFPFLCLLASGGHCQLVVVHGPGRLTLLGQTLDDAPGEAFDKIGRRLRLHILPEYRLWNGGRAIEHAAQLASDPQAYDFPLPLAQQRNCNFSFAGIKNNSFRAIRRRERLERTPPDGVISNYGDFCAGLLRAVSRHLMHRTQRAIEYCLQPQVQELFGDSPPTLVMSGGVANNDAIYANIAHLAAQYGWRSFRPSKRYCSDNGVMIAWHGVEQLLQDKEGSLRFDYDQIDIQGSAGFAESQEEAVTAAALKCKWIQPLC